jgi:hypothetical protein
MKARRLADRGALIGSAVVVNAGVVWLVLHPAAVGILLLGAVAGCLAWRLRLGRRRLEKAA